MTSLSLIRSWLYAVLIQPRQTDPTLRNRELVFNVVLTGTGLCVALMASLLLQSYAAGNGQVLGRLTVAAGCIAFVAGLSWLSRRISYQLSAALLTAFYFCLAVISVCIWGIGVPFGNLLMALAIVLAATAVGPRQALLLSLLSAIALIAVQVLLQVDWQPATAPPDSPHMRGELGDAIGQAVVLAVLGIISWLFGSEVEKTLDRAERAEMALEAEKAGLETRIAERTAELKEAQIQEMQQLYSFAEVGQLSTALLHDLANHLTVLTLEIEGLQSRRHAERLSRSRQIIDRLNEMTNAVRDRLVHGPARRSYDLLAIVEDSLSLARLKDADSQIEFVWKRPSRVGQYRYVGDPIKWGQVLGILLGNAVDACCSKANTQGHMTVAVEATLSDDALQFKITDWCNILKPADRQKIFKMDFSTKESGMGIGLYLARHMVASEFGGSLVLSPDNDRTTFVVTIPRRGRPVGVGLAARATARRRGHAA